MCHPSDVRAKNLQEIRVYRKALSAADAVVALLARPSLSRNFDLADQLSRSSSRVAPLIAEGFGQLTDRHVAVYLGRARGSALETSGHLEQACNRRLISDADFLEVNERYVVIGKMLTRWIGYLQVSDWKNRH